MPTATGSMETTTAGGVYLQRGPAAGDGLLSTQSIGPERSWAGSSTGSTAGSAPPRPRQVLDRIKDLGFQLRHQAGTTMAINDISCPREGRAHRQAEEQVEKIELQYRRGLITAEERYQQVIAHLDGDQGEGHQGHAEDTWTSFNPVYMMAISGARGNESQISPAGGHAGPDGRPVGPDHRDAHQGQLPRGADGAGVLHLHPRRPQGPGRHRPADRRLGLPDPPPGGRGAGRDRPGGGLRHHRGIVVGARSSDGDEVIEPLQDRIVGRVALRGRRASRRPAR